MSGCIRISKFGVTAGFTTAGLKMWSRSRTIGASAVFSSAVSCSKASCGAYDCGACWTSVAPEIIERTRFTNL